MDDLLSDIIKKLNDEDKNKVTEGLDLIRKSSGQVLDAYLERSPLAFEVTRAWNEAKTEANERVALSALIVVLESCTVEKAKTNLAWSLLKSEFVLERIAIILSKYENIERVVIGVRFLAAIGKQDIGLAREVFARFNLSHISNAMQDDNKMSKDKGAIARRKRLKNELAYACASLVARCALVGDEHARRLIFDSSLVAITLDALLDISDVDLIQNIARCMIDYAPTRLTVSNKFLGSWSRCAKLHPNETVRQCSFDLLVEMIRSRSDKITSRLLDFLDPIQDERHASLLELSLSNSTTVTLAGFFENKRSLSILEPRLSFPWIRTVSLVCRLLLSCPLSTGIDSASLATKEILPPESVLSRACLNRALQHENGLVKLFGLDLLIHILYRAISAYEFLTSAQERRLFSDHLAKRMPDPSALLGLMKGQTEADQQISMRVLRAIELFCRCGVNAGVDAGRFIALLDPSNSLLSFRALQVLEACETLLLPEDWLKNVASNNQSDSDSTRLGALVRFLVKQDHNSAVFKQGMLLAVRALQGRAPFDRSLDDLSHCSALLDASDRPVLCLLKAKYFFEVACKSEAHALALEAALQATRKNKQLNLMAVFDDELSKRQCVYFKGASESDELYLMLDAAPASFDSLLDAAEKKRWVDYPEAVCKYVGGFIDSGYALARTVLDHVALELETSRGRDFVAHLCLHALITNGLNVSVGSLQALNRVQNILKEIVDPLNDRLHSRLLEMIESYAEEELNNITDLEAKVYAAAMLKRDARLKIALSLAKQGENLSDNALVSLLNLDEELLHDNSVMVRILQKLPVFQKEQLDIVFDAFNKNLNKKSWVFLNVLESNSDTLLEKVPVMVQHDNGRQFVSVIASVPGIIATRIGEQFLGQLVKECAFRYGVSPGCNDKVTEWVTMHGATDVDPGLLREYIKLPLVEDLRMNLLLQHLDVFEISDVKSILLSISSKSGIDKHLTKSFLKDTLVLLEKSESDVSVRCLVLRRLVEVKRLKGRKVFDDIAGNIEILRHRATELAPLLSACLRIDEDKCIETLDKEKLSAIFHALLSRFTCSYNSPNLALLDALELLEKHSRGSVSMIQFGYAFGTFLSPVEYYQARHDETKFGLTISDKSVTILLKHLTWIFDGLDHQRLRKRFPLQDEAGNEGIVDGDGSEDNQTAYIPRFLLRAFDYYFGLAGIAMGLPTKAFVNPEDNLMTYQAPIRKIVNNGMLDFIITSLAIEDEQQRRLAYNCLQRTAQLLSRVPVVSFKERDEVLLLLRLFKESLDDPFQRVQPVALVHLQEFVHILARNQADHPQFTRVNAFLLAEDAKWDLTDLPLFMQTFHSGSMVYESDRTWSLNVTARGILTQQDLRPLLRRFVIESCIELFASSRSDQSVRRSILKLFKAIATCPQASSKKDHGAKALVERGFITFALDALAQIAQGDSSKVRRKPMWRIADDRGDDNSLSLAGEICELLSIIAKRRERFARKVFSRDTEHSKRAKSFVGCDWTVLEGDFAIAAPQLIRFITTEPLKASEKAVRSTLQALNSQSGVIRLLATDVLPLFILDDYRSLVESLVCSTVTVTAAWSSELLVLTRLLVSKPVADENVEHACNWITNLVTMLAPSMFAELPLQDILALASRSAQGGTRLSLALATLKAKTLDQQSQASMIALLEEGATALSSDQTSADKGQAVARAVLFGAEPPSERLNRIKTCFV